jgi:hypothetical protein
MQSQVISTDRAVFPFGAVFFTEDGFEPRTYEQFTSVQVIDGGLACEISDVQDDFYLQH